VEAEPWWATLEEHASKSKDFNHHSTIEEGLAAFSYIKWYDMHLHEIYEQTRISFSSVVLQAIESSFTSFL
jgi:hypothetical protein